jgi:hypothetical protein
MGVNPRREYVRPAEWGKLIIGDFVWGGEGAEALTGNFEVVGDEIVFKIKLSDLHKIIKSGKFNLGKEE